MQGIPESQDSPFPVVPWPGESLSGLSYKKYHWEQTKSHPIRLSAALFPPNGDARNESD